MRHLLLAFTCRASYWLAHPAAQSDKHAVIALAKVVIDENQNRAGDGGERVERPPNFLWRPKAFQKKVDEIDVGSALSPLLLRNTPACVALRQDYDSSPLSIIILAAPSSPAEKHSSFGWSDLISQPLVSIRNAVCKSTVFLDTESCAILMSQNF